MDTNADDVTKNSVTHDPVHLHDQIHKYQNGIPITNENVRYSPVCDITTMGTMVSRYPWTNIARGGFLEDFRWIVFLIIQLTKNQNWFR